MRIYNQLLSLILCVFIVSPAFSQQDQSGKTKEEIIQEAIDAAEKVELCAGIHDPDYVSTVAKVGKIVGTAAGIAMLGLQVGQLTGKVNAGTGVQIGVLSLALAGTFAGYFGGAQAKAANSLKYSSKVVEASKAGRSASVSETEDKHFNQLLRKSRNIIKKEYNKTISKSLSKGTVIIIADQLNRDKKKTCPINKNKKLQFISQSELATRVVRAYKKTDQWKELKGKKRKKKKKKKFLGLF